MTHSDWMSNRHPLIPAKPLPIILKLIPLIPSVFVAMVVGEGKKGRGRAGSEDESRRRSVHEDEEGGDASDVEVERSGETGIALAMVRSFKEFAAAMMRARKSLVRRRRDSEAGGEDSRAAMGSRAYLDNLGPIAVETLCLWCSRVGGTGAVKNVEVLDDIGSAAADALNALFLEEPKFSLRLLLPAGVVPALIHACSTSRSSAMQTAGAGALLNLAREEEARKEIVMAGGISSLISLLRQKPCPPAVARSACGALQNISLTAIYEDPLIDSGALEVLISLLSNSSDELVQERAAACIANLTAGGERARLAVLERKGVPVLVQQLEVVKRKNARTGVSELAPPSLSMICAVGGALKGLAQLPKVDGMLYGTGAIMQTAVLLEYLKMSMEWRPAVIGEEGSRALEALMGFIRNVSVHATQGKHREELRKSNLGVVVGKFVKQLCPAETERFPEHARRLLVEAISAVRNLSIGNEEMQNQLGSSGVIETLTGLVEKMLEAPWRSEVLLVETLHALANCMQNSSLNRQRALAARLIPPSPPNPLSVCSCSSSSSSPKNHLPDFCHLSWLHMESDMLSQVYEALHDAGLTGGARADSRRSMLRPLFLVDAAGRSNEDAGTRWPSHDCARPRKSPCPCDCAFVFPPHFPLPYSLQRRSPAVLVLCLTSAASDTTSSNSFNWEDVSW